MGPRGYELAIGRGKRIRGLLEFPLGQAGERAFHFQGQLLDLGIELAQFAKRVV